MDAKNLIIKEISSFHEKGRPLALALSGGPDSLALFYILIAYRKKSPFDLHIIHVDHGWRQESAEEARALEQLTKEHALSFHLKRLRNRPFKDAENQARLERIAFYKEVMQKVGAQAVCLGHHRDDLAETVLKRVFEGAAMERIGAFSFETKIGALTLWRPLIHYSKKEIALKNGFDDPTNRDKRLLRTRLREEVLPSLEKQFGKNICGNLVQLSRRSHMLADYLQKKCARWLPKPEIKGPYFADFSGAELLEIEYVLGALGKLPRALIIDVAKALYHGELHSSFEMGSYELIAHKHQFLIYEKKGSGWEMSEPLEIKAAAPWQALWTQGGYWPVQRGKLVLVGDLEACDRKKLFATPLFKPIPSALRFQLPVSLKGGAFTSSLFLRRSLTATSVDFTLEIV